LAYAFAPGEKNITKALRRIARQRVDASLALFDDAELGEDKRIHELRKNIKKLRGLIRLVRPVFADYEAENRALGDAGRALSHLRDADVRAAGLVALARRARLRAEDRDALIAAAGGAATPPGLQERETALLAHFDMLRQLRHRIEDWKVKGKGFDALEPGLVRVLDRGAKAMKAARNDPEGEAVHTWRKRVKDHWYHARLLTPIWPAMMKPHSDIAGDLGEMLGDARDLTLLAELLDPLAAEGLAGAENLAARARREETELMDRAHATGRLFHAEAPGALARRWRGWWERAAS